MRMVWEIRLGGKLPKMNASDRQHWRVAAREAKDWRVLAYWTAVAAMRDAKWPPVAQGIAAELGMPVTEITLTRVSSASSCDADNLRLGGKHLIDGMVDAGIMQDDSPRYLAATYRHEKGQRGKGYYRVEVSRE